MSLPVELTLVAQDEYDDALAYYASIRDDLADKFEAEAFHRVTTHPQIGAIIAPNVRRVRFRSLPYNVLYSETDGN